MGPVWKTVVLLCVFNAVLCTPVINKLQPGQEWPARSSVHQPKPPGTEVLSESDDGIKETEDAIEVIKAPEGITKEAEPEVIDAPAESPVKDTPIETEVKDLSKEPEIDVIVTKQEEKDIRNEAESNITPIQDVPEQPKLKDIPEIFLPETEDTRKDSEDAVVEPERVDYSGCQVWKVSTSKSEAKKVINKLASQKLIASWGGNQSTIDVLVKPNVMGDVANAFNSKDIPYSIMIEDLQQRINEENPPLDEEDMELQERRARAYNFWRYRAPHRRIGFISVDMGYNYLDIPMEYWPNANWGHRMTWKQYHRVDDIHGFMDYLAKTYPSLVSVNTIGKSHEGRDLKVLRISDGKPTNKAVFIDGGIHAREWISPAVVTFFINQFAENFDVESEDIKNIDWYFLPVVNPDGYEYTHKADRLWRKNRGRNGITSCTGTDLNRNFGYHWGEKGASSSSCSDIYRGKKAFSEPESRAISDFFKSTAAKFSAYLTYHSYGQYILYPWGYDNVVPPDHKNLQIVGEQVAEAIQRTGGSKYKVGSSSGLLYPASGGSDDWAKSLGIKYSYTIELSDTGRFGFVLPASYIEPVAKENLVGLRTLARVINDDSNSIERKRIVYSVKRRTPGA